MATQNTVKETVEIQELSKYGFKANNVYYNWGKFIKDEEKTPVVPGATFEMELFVSESGKKYVNRVIKELKTEKKAAVVKEALTPVGKVIAKAPAKHHVAVNTGRDFDKEARGKTRCAILEAALQSPYVQTLASVDEVKEFVKSMIAFGMPEVFSEDK